MLGCAFITFMRAFSQVAAEDGDTPAVIPLFMANLIRIMAAIMGVNEPSILIALGNYSGSDNLF